MNSEAIPRQFQLTIMTIPYRFFLLFGMSILEPCLMKIVTALSVQVVRTYRNWMCILKYDVGTIVPRSFYRHI